MARFRVVITDFLRDELTPERRVLNGMADLDALGVTSEGELPGRVEEADALLVYHEISLSETTISRLHSCKIIVRCGVGHDNIDVAAARERGIPVANVPDYATEEVADSTVGLILSLTRGIASLSSRLRVGGDVPWNASTVAPLHRLRGRVLALVGLGEIGMAVAVRAKAFGLDVCFYDPYVPPGREKAIGIRRVESLNELLEQAHILSLHCRLTDETHHLIDEAALETMPGGAYLVNTARGGLVDTRALLDAIESRQLAGAALDVLPREPPSPDDPLLAAWRDPDHPAHHRLIVNPHSAWYSEEALTDLRTKAADTVRRALLGQTVRTVVNR